MPLYEYECEACGFRFELIQRFSDAPVEQCRSCGGKVHKLLSAPAIQFKGTGWYITDYAGKKPESAPSSTSSAGSSGSPSTGSSAGAAPSASSGTGEPASGSSAEKKD